MYGGYKHRIVPNISVDLKGWKLFGAYSAAGFALRDGAERLVRISAYCLSELPCRIHIVLFYFEGIRFFVVPLELQLRYSLLGACAMSGVTSSSLCSHAIEEMLLGLRWGRGLFWVLSVAREP